MSIARALTIANQAVIAEDMNLADSSIEITEESTESGKVSRIYYGPRNIRQRGGDLTVYVDQQTGEIRKIIVGQ